LYRLIVLFLLTLSVLQAWEARFGGDLRLRREWDFQSQRSNGVKRNNRMRTRLRLRPEIKVKLSEETGFVFRLRTGNLEAIQSSNYTLIQNFGNKGRNDFPNYDRLVLTRKFGNTRWSFGRNQVNYWRQNEYLWDKDVAVDGIERSQSLGKGRYLNLGWFHIPRGAEPVSFSNRSTLFLAQYMKRKRSKSKDIHTWALGFLGVRDGGNDWSPLSATGNRDYDIVHLAYQKQFALRNRMKIGLDFFTNLQNYPTTLPLGEEKDAWSAQIYFGDLTRPGDLKYGLRYGNVGAYAMNPYTANDNWTRWSKASYTEASNYTGWQASAAYQFKNDQTVTLKYIAAHEKEVLPGNTQQSSHRIRLDYVWKF